MSKKYQIRSLKMDVSANFEPLYPEKFEKNKKIKSPGNLGESCRKNSAKLGENTAKMTRIF